MENNNEQLKERIGKGISFFTSVVKPGHYDATQVEKYLPNFLNLVAAYMANEKINIVQLDETPRQATIEDAERIFTREENEKIISALEKEMKDSADETNKKEVTATRSQS